DSIFVSGFALIGAESFEIKSEEELTHTLKQLIESNNYAVIILPERFVENTKELRFKLIKEGKITPIFAFIPDYTGIKGKRIEELKKSISLAVGAELKL
ncbi:MAG: V-type ATP synthase subunit F, partial [Candidatus Bathyarchaeia archaeon]